MQTDLVNGDTPTSGNVLSPPVPDILTSASSEHPHVIAHEGTGMITNAPQSRDIMWQGEVAEPPRYETVA